MGTFSIWHWLIVLIVMFLPGLPALWVLKRAGKSRWQFLLAVIPLVNVIWLWVFAFSRWLPPSEPLDGPDSSDEEEPLPVEVSNTAFSEMQEPAPVDAPSSGSIEEKKTVKGSSYFGRHWRGENSLAWAYWINLFLLNVVTTISVTIIQKQTDFLDEWVPWALLSISTIGIAVWSCVGVWRSASVSIDSAKIKIPKRNTFWAYAAKTMVVIGVLQTLAVWVPTVKDLSTFYELSKSDINTQFFIQEGGKTDIVFTGYINSSSVDAVKKAFQADKDRTTLVINSPGGVLLDAYKLADFVEQKKILVAARGDCQSACILVLAAAETAVVTPETRLVFHHPEKLADFVSAGVEAEFSEEIKEYYKRFRDYGVPEEKLKTYRQNKLTDLSIGEAYNSYLVDKIWEPKSNRFFDAKAVCKELDCFKIPMEFSIKILVENGQKLAALELRKQLPKRIDELTTLQNVTSVSTALMYQYKLDISKSDVDVAFFKSEMKNTLIENTCSKKDSKLTLMNGGEYMFSYQDSEGLLITDFTITISDCS
jgi:ATP-dependent protease ClpP protease subunit